jgi:hypothetical protein
MVYFCRRGCIVHIDIVDPSCLKGILSEERKGGETGGRVSAREMCVGGGGDGGCSVVDPLSPSGSSHPITHEIFSGARGESGALLSTDLFTEPVVVSSVFS